MWCFLSLLSTLNMYIFSCLYFHISSFGNYYVPFYWHSVQLNPQMITQQIDVGVCSVGLNMRQRLECQKSHAFFVVPALFMV